MVSTQGQGGTPLTPKDMGIPWTSMGDKSKQAVKEPEVRIVAANYEVVFDHLSVFIQELQANNTKILADLHEHLSDPRLCTFEGIAEIKLMSARERGYRDALYMVAKQLEALHIEQPSTNGDSHL